MHSGAFGFTLATFGSEIEMNVMVNLLSHLGRQGSHSVPVLISAVGGHPRNIDDDRRDTPAPWSLTASIWRYDQNSIAFSGALPTISRYLRLVCTNFLVTFYETWTKLYLVRSFELSIRYYAAWSKRIQVTFYKLRNHESSIEDKSMRNAPKKQSNANPSFGLRE